MQQVGNIQQQNVALAAEMNKTNEARKSAINFVDFKALNNVDAFSGDRRDWRDWLKSRSCSSCCGRNGSIAIVRCACASLLGALPRIRAAAAKGETTFRDVGRYLLTGAVVMKFRLWKARRNFLKLTFRIL